MTINIPVTEQEFEALKSIAEHAGENRIEWLRAMIRTEAEKTGFVFKAEEAEQKPRTKAPRKKKMVKQEEPERVETPKEYVLYPGDVVLTDADCY